MKLTKKEIQENKESNSPMPILLAETKDGQLIQMPIPFESTEEKIPMMFIAGKIIAKQFKEYKAFHFIFDTWYVTAKTKEIDCPPSQHPDRMEAIVYDYYLLKETQREMTIYPYDSSKGKIKWKKEIKKKPTKIDSPLIDSFMKGYSQQQFANQVDDATSSTEKLFDISQ